MARSVVAADLLLNSSLSQPCLPETTRRQKSDVENQWKAKKEMNLQLKIYNLQFAISKGEGKK